MISDIKIKKATIYDQENVLKILAEWIDVERLEHRFKWLYQNNPDGPMMTWLSIMKDSGSMSGIASQIPRKLNVFNNQISSSLGTDLYIRPQYRQLGIATKFHKFCRQDKLKHSIFSLYGFAVEHNLKALEKNGAVGLGQLQEIVLPLNSSLYLKKILGRTDVGFLSKVIDRFIRKSLIKKIDSMDYSLKYCEITEFHPDYDTLLKNNPLSEYITTNRSCRYLNWRYFEIPHKKYCVMKFFTNDTFWGYVVYEEKENTLYIIDFLVEKSMIESAILCIFSYGLEKKYDIIRMTLNPHGPYFENFVNAGFKPRGLSYNFVVQVEKQFPYKDAMLDMKNWYLTYSDTDLE